MPARRKPHPAVPDDTPDHVDTILAQWARERPDLDASPMGLIGRVARLNRHTGKSIESALAETALQPWEFDVLATLRRSGPPFALSPGALIGSLMITSGTMTNRLDHLERAGLVQRRPNPDDRRGLLVELTGAGRERIDHAVAVHVENEHRLVEALSATERVQLATLLRRWLRQFEPPPGGDETSDA